MTSTIRFKIFDQSLFFNRRWVLWWSAENFLLRRIWIPQLTLLSCKLVFGRISEREVNIKYFKNFKKVNTVPNSAQRTPATLITNWESCRVWRVCGTMVTSIWDLPEKKTPSTPRLLLYRSSPPPLYALNFILRFILRPHLHLDILLPPPHACLQLHTYSPVHTSHRVLFHNTACFPSLLYFNP